jgi:hypothetical protein
MSEFGLFVCMEHYFVARRITEGRTGWNQATVCFNAVYLPLLFIPDEDLGIPDFIVCLAEVMLVNLFALSFQKVTFRFLLLDLSHINPSILVLAQSSLTKYIILKNLLVLLRYHYGVKSPHLLDSALLVIGQLRAC